MWWSGQVREARRNRGNFAAAAATADERDGIAVLRKCRSEMAAVADGRRWGDSWGVGVGSWEGAESGYRMRGGRSIGLLEKKLESVLLSTAAQLHLLDQLRSGRRCRDPSNDVDDVDDCCCDSF